MLGEVARGRPDGDPLHSVTLMRGDLVEVLREAAVRADARIVTGQRLAGVVDGADLVVGADGLWSGYRGELDATAAEPSYAGLYSVFRGVARPCAAFRDIQHGLRPAGHFPLSASPGWLDLVAGTGAFGPAAGPGNDRDR
ncbi:hypothetical protein [Fodinicola feengrottensis]|uniref:hypothetical protein n=1 Tax=Fodinicola feengrottensis TaxID=435914 RepID=UPI0024433A13|nr:hypothetical protein [Fodinicola feengrottensis]